MAVSSIEVAPIPTRGHKVWLIGGTSESAELAQALWARKIPYIVTVTTPAAKKLYPSQAQVKVCALTPGAMATFVIQHDIRCILDASHPFATEVSQQAIALSQSRQSQSRQSQLTPSPTNAVTKQPIPYLRYERVSIAAEPTGNIRTRYESLPCPTANVQSDTSKTELSEIGAVSPPDIHQPDIHQPDIHQPDIHQPDIHQMEATVTTVASIESLVKSDLLHHQRVLFTLGYRNLAQFSPLRPKATLFARVLPSPEAISGAMSAGFSAHEIIALRPPVSLALEKALWQQWQISRVVAKASGRPSGEAVKRQAAGQLGIQLILIQRPLVVYPKQTHSVKEAIAFCTQTLRMY